MASDGHEEERWREVFASLIEDEPESSVTPMTVLAAAKRDQAAGRRHRRRTVLGSLVAAAAVAGLAVLGVNLAPSPSSTNTADRGSAEAAGSAGGSGYAANPLGSTTAAPGAGVAEPQVASGTSSPAGGPAAPRTSYGPSTGPAPASTAASVPTAAAPSPGSTTGSPGVTKLAPTAGAPATAEAGGRGPEGAISGGPVGVLPCGWPMLSAAEQAAVTASAPVGTLGTAESLTAPCLTGRLGAAEFPATRSGGAAVAVTVRTAPDGSCRELAVVADRCAPAGDGLYRGAGNAGAGSGPSVYAYGSGLEVQVSTGPAPGGPDSAQLAAIARAVLAATG